MRFAPVAAWSAAVLLFLAPAVNLVWQGGTGYCFFALLAMALYMGVRYRSVSGYFSVLRDYPWYVVGMCGLVLAIFVQQLVYGIWAPRQFDAYSRFALAIPIFLMLRQMPARHFRALGWGCAAGALVLGALALAHRPVGGWTDADRLNNDYTNAIPYGDTALLLAFLSVFTIGWDGKHRRLTAWLKFAALVAGGFSSYSTGTRGGWLAIPVFVVMLGVQYGWFANFKRFALASSVVVLGAAALLSTPRIEQRVHDFVADVSMLSKGNPDTSTGIRLELWRASARLYAQHPIYGVGKGRLESSMSQLAKQGLMPSGAVNERAHSDFFSTLAESGSIGLLFLFVFYYGSTVYFWRRRRSTDAFIRTAAWSGMAVSASTIVFGLTIDVLVPIMVTVLVALLTATFLAAIDARQREIDATARQAAMS
ncbi:O-antigen ligase family protein [Paraburkholderia silviterrae]|uniref:O-antigen ligase domain-containing protein n=1 Tax=Paraburkholderia silviterrae TaxID=2528715 RepID=A0A4R5LYF5_9BURK|nr:O-antigen ligase family protein [Paraburkholderia silviterrae]TDG17423.1 O-antigen ligase domain-containing protein [Paraburkholderia silviterrae]